MEEEYEYYLYVLLNGHRNYTKVTKEEWIKAERKAGFRPKLPSNDPRYMTTCATGGFGDANYGGEIKWNDPRAIPDPDASLDELLDDEGDYDLCDDLLKDCFVDLKNDSVDFENAHRKAEQYKLVADNLLRTIMDIKETVGHIFPSLDTIAESSQKYRDDTFEAIENGE